VTPRAAAARSAGPARLSRIGLLSLIFLPGGGALPAAAGPARGDLPPEVPRPEFLRNKPLMPELLLKDKREGRYVTGIPAFGWDAEEDFNHPPFYALSRLGFNDFDRSGLGGFTTLRGYKNQRFTGTSSLLLNAELRWFFTEWMLWGQHLKSGVAFFGDVGRSYQDVWLGLSDVKGAGGVGFRLAWNLATLVSFDLGISSEDQVFYVELGTTF